MTEDHKIPSQYLYRLEQLEHKVASMNDKLGELLIELRAGKKAGKLLVGIAVVFGGFVSWLLTTWYQLLNIKLPPSLGGDS